MSDSTEPTPRDRRAFNAYRHGLSGHVLIIPPDEREAYEAHCRGIHQSLAPQGALETDLAQSIADDRWRIKRAAAIESNIFTLGILQSKRATAAEEPVDTAIAMARTWLENGKDIQLLTLYESRLQRKVEKNLALLRQIQQERRAALQQLVEEAAILPEAEQLPAASLPPQFDFSLPQIQLLAAHRRRLAEAATTAQCPPAKNLRSAA